MIWNEIRNRIEAKGDIQESKNNSRNKERKEYQNQKRERESGSSQVVQSHRTSAQKNKRLISGHANPGSSESDLVSVCVKGKTRAYKPGA